jgi:hypothetical protein
MESNCFDIDNVCNWKDSWFYAPPSQGDNKYHYQPTATLIGTSEGDKHIVSKHKSFVIDERIQVKISSKSHDLYPGQNICSFSPPHNHLVTHSFFNDMMGEFYARTILGLNRWMHDYPHRETQMYVHLVKNSTDIFEGHRLFLGGVPNNNIIESFASLMPRNDTCRCFKKLIFCGYSRDTVTSFRSDSSSRYSEQLRERIRSRIDVDDANGIVFIPGSGTTNPTANVHSDFAFHDLRRDLMKTYLLRYRDLEEQIRRYRRNILVQMGLLGNSTIDAEERWTFVGFSRRKARRLWLNIDDAISMCNEKFGRYRVACITVDVEEANDAKAQLLMHRSLHAFIGIHGAQLTQGVVLPTHGYVLELLPWIPSYCHGNWVASTSGPTPLGVIFHNTDMNHYGYSLGRESTPICLEVDISDEKGTQACLTNRENEQRFAWDTRDFIVSIRVIEDFVWAVLRHVDNATCDEMSSEAERANFVLYNAFCRETHKTTRFVTKQYYRKRV